MHLLLTCSLHRAMRGSTVTGTPQRGPIDVAGRWHLAPVLVYLHYRGVITLRSDLQQAQQAQQRGGATTIPDHLTNAGFKSSTLSRYRLFLFSFFFNLVPNPSLCFSIDRNCTRRRCLPPSSSRPSQSSTNPTTRKALQLYA